MLTSKLIDGTFPDYERVIPQGNDKRMEVDNAAFAQAVDRVSTLSSDKGRAVKLTITDGKLTLSVNNPDSGSATEELPVEYGFDPLEIGFNARYLLDISGQLESGTAEFQLADPGSPTMVRDGKDAVRALRAHADAGMRARPQRERVRSRLMLPGRSPAPRRAFTSRAQAHRFPQLCAAPSSSSTRGRWC